MYTWRGSVNSWFQDPGVSISVKGEPKIGGVWEK